MLVFYGTAGLLGLWFVVPYTVRKVDVYRLRKLCQKHRTIALTFDDGPSNSVTSKLLHLLAEFRAYATFFALGHKIESDKEACALIAGGGHEFGSHSYRHLNAWKQSPLAVYRDIDKGLSLVRKLNAAPFFRPPHGKITLATLLQVFLVMPRKDLLQETRNDHQVAIAVRFREMKRVAVAMVAREIPAQLDGLATLGRTERISGRASDELIAAIHGFIHSETA